MQRSLIRLAMVAAVVASAGLASCSGDAPTEAPLSQALSDAHDSTGGDSIPGDTVPGDSIPGDTIPGDSVAPDTIPPDTIPPDTIPPDTIPPDTIPPDTVPPDTVPPDTIPPDTTVVRAFDLAVTVVGADSSGDTLTTLPLSGARVTLYRFASLPDSGSVPDAVSAARRTGRDGRVVFHRLPPAWYRVEVEPPAGTPYLPGSALVAPATSEYVPVQVLLLRAP